MEHICIVGGGSALAKPLIKLYLEQGHKVTAVCKQSEPPHHPDLKVTHCMGHVDGGNLHSLITMTGAVANAKLDKMTDEDWQKSLDSNLTAVFQAFKYILPKVNTGGSVVVVGSIVGSTGGIGCANYAAAKAGLVGLVRAAANEYPRVRTNLLELGYVDAGMGQRLPAEIKVRVKDTIPLRRFATVAEFVDAVEFVRKAYATGEVFRVAGGLR